MPIEKLSLTNVGPLDEIEFEFDPQVNVFTGPNNSGKSSALWALGEIVVYPFQFPRKLLRSDGDATFRIHISGGVDSGVQGKIPISMGEEFNYDFREHINTLKTIGFSKYIPALRWSTDFRSPGPTTADRNEPEPFRIRYHPITSDNMDARRLQDRLRARRTDELDPELVRRQLIVDLVDSSLVSDEAIIQKIIDLDYRSYIRESANLRNIVDRIGQITSEITDGFPLKFIRINEDSGGFFPEFDTVDGPMPLNTLSQGTQSIIQWLAHLLVGYAEYYKFPDNLTEKPGVLIIDEIDAHLHPSWQRRIIPTLTHHFPNLQIFLFYPFAPDAGWSQGRAGTDTPTK